MSDEEKIIGDQHADSTSEEDAEEDQDTEVVTDKPDDTSFDYGKALEDAQQGSRYSPQEKATHAFKGITKQLKEFGIDPLELLGGKQDVDESKGGQQQGDKPITAADVERIMTVAQQKAQDAALDPIIDSKITPITRSADEAKLTKHYTNIMRAHTSNLDEAVEMGWYLANRHRFKDTFSEITRGAGAARGKTDGKNSGQKRQESKAEPTGKEAEFAKRRGLVWDAEGGKFTSPAKKAFLDKQRKSKK